jgi:thiopurine S-methyltransferase
MQPEFWKTAWSEGRIAFHEGTPNTFLEKFADRLPKTHVLVPLCGKTDDLAFLAGRGHTVIGIELVEDAVKAFFAEHQITPTVTHHGELARYSAGPITLIAGDLFTVTREDVGRVDAIYDRAALIALPPELRTRYVAHLRTLAPAATPALLITLDYPQDQMSGPPFALSDAEVRATYPHVEQLAERPATGGRVGQISGSVERCYAVTL